MGPHQDPSSAKAPHIASCRIAGPGDRLLLSVGHEPRALNDPHARGTTCCISRMTSARGSCTSGAGGSVCRSRSPCQVSAIQDVMRRDSYELAGRGRSFGAVYIALPRHGRKPACQPPAHALPAGETPRGKGERAAFWRYHMCFSIRTKMPLFYTPASPSRPAGFDRSSPG